MSEPIIDSLIALSGSDNVVVVHRAFVHFTGSLETGMMLGQLLYWTPRARLPGGWIAKSDAEWSDELCISAYAARKARGRLVKMDIIETKLAQFSGAPTMHYRVNRKRLTAAWSAWIEGTDFAKAKKRFCESEESDSMKPQERSSENAESITEITTETTTEITSKDHDTPGPDEAAREWIAKLIAQQPPERPAPRTAEELMEGTRRASEGWMRRLQADPHLLWGADSEAADRALASLDGEADQVRWLGFEIERIFRLAPDWEKPKKVRHWITSLHDCLRAAKFDPGVVIEAGGRLRRDSCTLAGPWSFENTTRAIAAEREAEDAGLETGSGDRRWTAEDIARANAAAADTLSEPG